jgi:serine/threonine protein kinase
MKPLAPNTLLQNRYLIVHLIGKGGMGEVYLAVDQRLGSAVALKRTFFSDDELLGSAFEREARTLARLRHPVLPKVSDHFTENELQYLVMEHITGDDLAKRLELTNKPFPLNWVLFWADQLLDALAYLHGHNPPIIHRDIKPQNLKLTDENHIVLLDFGLAKDTVGNTKISSTTGGSIVGYTPHYASMEQIRGTGTNPRSDIYSMAATFYQLLTNTVPPDALTRADSVLNGLADPTKPLSELNPEIPKTISDVFMKGMALSMEQRYPNARDMQKALREAYAEMQNIMAAQTMAFNAPAVQNQAIPQSQQATEQFSTNVIGQASAQNGQQETAAFDSFSEAKLDESAAAAGSSQRQNLDAEMKNGEDSLGMKTEVLPFEKIPRAEGYSSPSAPAAPAQNFADEDFSSEPEADFNPEATIPPLVNFGKPQPERQPEQDFNSFPRNEANNEAKEESFQPAQPASQAEAAVTPPPVQAEPKKKSGGKGLAIAAGIGGLAVVAVGAAAIGWYALKPSEVTVNPTPTPQVEATAEPTVAPSIEPTVEPTIEAVTTPTEATTEVVSSTPESTDGQQNVNSQVSKTPNVQPTPAKAAPTPRIAGGKTPAPAKTPPPAKTPAKSTRTDILQ